MTIVSDGAAAVQACLHQSFDLVFMDLQMPVMDGLTATREIRRRESPGSHTRIIALTASAMTGQLERCIDAGMDGVLTKPLENIRLREILNRYDLAAKAPETGAHPAVALEQPRRVPVNLERLQDAIGADAELMDTLCHTFLTSSDELMRKLDAAVATTDRDAIRAAAHTLRGSGGSMHARRLADATAALERSAPHGSIAELNVMMAETRAALAECIEYLQARAT